MAKIPDTVAGCKALLEIVERELKALNAQRYALISRIAERSPPPVKAGSEPTSEPARAASAKGGGVKGEATKS